MSDVPRIADPKTPTVPPSVAQSLQQAVDGLLFPSETDAPFVPFFWSREKPANLTSEQLTRLAGIPADIPVKSVKLQTFFRPATEEKDWHNEEEKAQVKRFENLVETIKDVLEDVKVFRVGETTVDVYIVGQVEGGYAGLKTQVVET